MATLPLTDAQPDTSTHSGAPTLLVCLPPLPADTQAAAMAHLHDAFPAETLLIAGAPADEHMQCVEYASPRSQLGWVLAAADYASAHATLSAHAGPGAVLLLGADASTLPAQALRELVENVRNGMDLAVPRYPVGASAGLVSSALLYPLTRALFSADIRFPVPVHAALSPRLLARLASAAARTTALPTGGDSMLWPVAEAAAANMRVTQVDTPPRTLPSPPDQDLNTLLATVAGSFFADIEAKATTWQRSRAVTPATVPAGQKPDTTDAQPPDPQELAGMIDGFRLASANLTEIWQLVLPPQSLMAIKRLSRMTNEEFALDPSIWARIVYDFALAFHMRTLNRGHLLGAMTPIYLAWVASHIRSSQNDPVQAARLVEATAQAFEREKPYFVSRWRWPDRFNP